MHEIYQIRSDLINKLSSSPTLEDLRTFFVARTNEWKYPYMEVEGGGIDLFSDLIQSLETHQAFKLIDCATQLALEQTNGELFTTALSLVGELAETTKTTEIPPRLGQSWDVFANMAKSFSETKAVFYLKELQRHYGVSLQHQMNRYNSD